MERESKSQLSIRVEAELRQQLERLARKEDRPLSYLVPKRGNLDHSGAHCRSGE
jgi:predicted DNA-binding protein